MSSPLSSLQPEAPWGHFDAIRQIPRPSRAEQAVRAYVLDWAKARGFEARTDAEGSVVVRAPASPGHESAPPVVLQGHLDMVCEKDAEVGIDFERDGIDAFVEGDWVRARGTTLGADNGIGVALAMAAAEDPRLVHGPLELLLTVNEETGMSGARNLAPDFVTGRLLINLDSEEDGTLFVGCAGGGDALLTVPFAAGPAAEKAQAWSIAVGGLKGGHSGLDIHHNRGNALKILARVLRDGRAALPEGGLAIERLEGGDKPNAIPRDARAIAWLGEGGAEALRTAAEKVLGRAQQELGSWGAGLRIEVAEHPGSPEAAPPRVMAAASSDRIVDLLLALPEGVEAMSRDLPGLVETSTNLARIRTEPEAVTILTSSRSSVVVALDELRDRIRACAALAGARAKLGEPYPGWQPNMSSPLLETTREVFQSCFGEPPKVTAIHAGLECGIIGQHYPGMDMISFGPAIQGAHSPDERVSIPSTARCWTLLRALLERLG